MVATPALAHDSILLPFWCRRMTVHAPLTARLQPESFRMQLETMLFNLPRPHRVNTPLLVSRCGK